MRAAYYMKKDSLRGDARFLSMKEALEAEGVECYEVRSAGELLPATGLLLSVGGDGTFLSAAGFAAPAGIPVMGVNMGRLGFLSESDPEDVAALIAKGEYHIEERSVLEVGVKGSSSDYYPYAVNEIAVHSIGTTMIGIDVTVDGEPLPTYWADGLLVATPTGSTAYSLSVGGPICMPGSKVLVITPIAPHNLNLRPLVIPDSSRVEISVQSRDRQLVLSMDNRSMELPADASVSVAVAQFSLKRVRPVKSNFIGALKSKLFWGEDVRNL